MSVVSEISELLRFSQDVLKVQPGRSRPAHAKDWTVANTREVNWSRLGPFMRRHAKALDSYVKETFE